MRLAAHCRCVVVESASFHLWVDEAAHGRDLSVAFSATARLGHHAGVSQSHRQEDDGQDAGAISSMKPPSQPKWSTV